MFWQDKMASVLRNVVGEEYDLFFPEPNKVTVTFIDKEVLKRETMHETASHWRSDVREIILLLINQQIDSSLKSYDK